MHVVKQVYILVYVDDRLTIGPFDLGTEILSELSKVFCIKVVGQLDQDGDQATFLGREIKGTGTKSTSR